MIELEDKPKELEVKKEPMESITLGRHYNDERDTFNKMEEEHPRKHKQDHRKRDPHKPQYEPELLVGLVHPFVQQTNKFIASKLGRELSENSLSEKYLDFLELTKPFKIIKTLFLYKIGKPYQVEKGAEIQFNDGFTSWRTYRSFLNQGLIVYFYQAVLYIEELKQTVYVIIPEDNEEMILFHTDIKKLFNFVLNLIMTKQKDIMHYVKYKKTSKASSFVTISNEVLKKDIYTLMTIEKDSDILLQKLYSRFTESKKISEFDRVFTENAFVDNAIAAADKIVKNALKNLNINKDLSLGDILFGLHHPKVAVMLKIVK